MKFPWWKLIIGFLFYLFFHQVHEIFPGSLPGVLLGEGIPAIYPHMKMLFYSYLTVSLIDYALNRKRIKLEPFLYARMLILSAVPWMMIAIYFSFEAVGIVLPFIAELAWGIFMTAVGVYLCILFEKPFEGMPLNAAARRVIVLVFAATLITYVGFSFQVPDNFFQVLD